jgi:sialic acid synthase SpsE/mannose-6-phosphate isomerase-like protein (cupin superfamily)
MTAFDRSKFDFNGLFILDMANNHQGSLEHGLQIIRAFAPVVRAHGIRAAIKFQFRNLDTFIHPRYRDSKENKHIPRFLGTRLERDDFMALNDEVRHQGLVSMATPFDEESVALAMQLDVDVIKIASCSAQDWPLLNEIAETGKPVVCSAAGLSVEQTDNVVSFLDHRGVDYALMHCVAVYPTPLEKMNLQRIKLFKERFPHLEIGFSTHEDPDRTDIIKAAYAYGAQLFERHIGVNTESIKLNAYSSTPQQAALWFQAYRDTEAMSRQVVEPGKDEEEDSSLSSLSRGVYLRRCIRAGTPLTRDDVFFAMPIQPGQLKSSQWKSGFSAERDYAAMEMLPQSILPQTTSKKDLIYQAIHAVKGMLNLAHISVNYDSSVELSHHYGLETFTRTGAVIIDCINREYCKKIIVMLPGQTHPNHYHMRKEETFQVLAGELHVNIEGRPRIIQAGDTSLIPRGIWHSFTAPKGVIFEEISTTHFNDDSYYADKSINAKPRDERKTRLINWGRHQFDSTTA